MYMKWYGITGSWCKTSEQVEADVRAWYNKHTKKTALGRFSPVQEVIAGSNYVRA